jgi:DNA-binding transcriptional ArsR family regulator
MVSCTNVPQPTISQHLTILRAAGIIKANRQGNQMLYSVCSDQARAIIRGLA